MLRLRLSASACAVAALVAAAAPMPSVGDGSPVPAPGLSPPRPLPFFYDLYTFRGEKGGTSVVASFAVPVGELDRERVDGEVRYRFNVTLVLADTARGGWARADDSVFVVMDRPVDEEHLLHTWVETEARPSTTTIQRVLMINAPTPGTGQLYTRGFVIPDYSGDDLMLSDIALGLPGPGGGWKRGDVSLALLPSDHFPSGMFDVYYEVYNLPRGNPYVTEISIDPIFEAGSSDEGTGVQVRFSGESAGGRDGTLQELRRLDGSLPRGRYRLTVTVTDGTTGRMGSRSRVLQVREWGEGATLVTACPVTPGVRRPGCA